jgi:hypothetical protein
MRLKFEKREEKKSLIDRPASFVMQRIRSLIVKINPLK